MPPTLILVRHAQALHNVDRDYSIHDPVLSELGQTQCRTLRKHFFKTEVPDKYQISLIIVSPMRRTIETALLSFGNYAKENNIPIIAHAGWQENSDKPCDTGSLTEELSKEFPEVDFSRVDEVWPDKNRNSEKAKKYWYTKDAILQRGEGVLKEIEAKVWPEMEDGKAVIVVSHSGFLRSGVTGWWFNNGDYRIFKIEEREVKEGRPMMKQITGVKGGMGESFETPAGLGGDLPEAAVGGLNVGTLPQTIGGYTTIKGQHQQAIRVITPNGQASKGISTTYGLRATVFPMSQLSIEDFKRTLVALDTQIFVSARNRQCHVCDPISLRLDEILSSTDKSDFHPGTRDATDNIKLATIGHVFSNYSECGFCSLILRVILRAKERHLYDAIRSRPWVEDTIISFDMIREALKSMGSLTASERSSMTNSTSSLSNELEIFDPEDLILQVSVDAICDYGALSFWLPLGDSEDVNDNEFQLFLHPEDYRTLMGDVQNPDATLMIPKPLDRSTRDMDLMKRCLENCRTHHGRCKQLAAPNIEALQTAPSMLIDIVDMRLVSTNPSTDGYVSLQQIEYVALSYVWGRDPFFTLKSTNLSALCEKDAFRDPAIKFPQTILDAIEVTNFMGYRYLWIDSLCIEQDSTEDTVAQIGSMHIIYAQASLTIVAAVGDSAQHSMLHIDPSQLTSKYHTIGRLRFCLDRPEFKEVVASSTWATRGWTLQEVTCSDRFIFFTPERTYFSCALSNWNEDMALDEAIPAEQYQRYLRDEDPQGLGLDMAVEIGRDAQTSSIYISMVEKLSTRNFTHEKDILKASLGMYTMYMVDGLGMAVAGLPLYYLGAALMWQPIGPLRRRRCEGIPSWSWASWTGPISYPLGRLDGLDIQLTLDWFVDEFKGYRFTKPSYAVRASPGYIRYLQVTGGMPKAAQTTFRASAKEPGPYYFRENDPPILRRRIVNPSDRWMMNLSLAERTVLAFGGTTCYFPMRFREHEHTIQTSSHVHFCSIFSSHEAAEHMDNAELIGEMRVDSGTLDSFFPDQFSTAASNMGISTSVELLSFGHLNFSRENVQNVLYLNRYSRRGNFSPEFLGMVDANPDMVLVMWLFRDPGETWRNASRVAVGYLLRSRWDKAVKERGREGEYIRLQ